MQLACNQPALARSNQQSSSNDLQAQPGPDSLHFPFFSMTSHPKPALSINPSLPSLKRSAHSAFRPLARTPSTAVSCASSAVSSPALKGNPLQPTGNVLNELQRLQLLDGSDTTAPGSAVSSVGAEQHTSASPNDAAAVSPCVEAAAAAKLSEPASSSGVSGAVGRDEAASGSEGAGEEGECRDRGVRPLLRLSVDVLDLFRTCNPLYAWTGQLQPRRVLTSPSKPGTVNSYDNVNNNLIMSVGDLLWHSMSSNTQTPTQRSKQTRAHSRTLCACSFKSGFSILFVCLQG